MSLALKESKFTFNHQYLTHKLSNIRLNLSFKIITSNHQDTWASFPDHGDNDNHSDDYDYSDGNDDNDDVYGVDDHGCDDDFGNDGDYDGDDDVKIIMMIMMIIMVVIIMMEMMQVIFDLKCSLESQ